MKEKYFDYETEELVTTETVNNSTTVWKETSREPMPFHVYMYHKYGTKVAPFIEQKEVEEAPPLQPFDFDSEDIII